MLFRVIGPPVAADLKSRRESQLLAVAICYWWEEAWVGKGERAEMKREIREMCEGGERRWRLEWQRILAQCCAHLLCSGIFNKSFGISRFLIGNFMKHLNPTPFFVWCFVDAEMTTVRCTCKELICFRWCTFSALWLSWIPELNE